MKRTGKWVSKKQCSVDGCHKPVFGRGYCQYHYRNIYQAAKQRENPRQKTALKPISDKRKNQVAEYHRRRKAYIEAARRFNPRGEIYCIFCDEIIKGEPDLHHGLGRDDEMLLDEVYWFLAHNHCHVHQYHSMSWKVIPWWDNYMFRMQYINPKVYKKDLLKMGK
jgi:hypothetical protein